MSPRNRKALVKDLARLPQFADCSPRELKRIADMGIVLAVGRHAPLMTEGWPSFEFCIILRGRAAYVVGGQCERVLHAGDYFGEMAVLGRSAPRASVVTEEPAEVMVFDRNELRLLLEASPVLTARVLADGGPAGSARRSHPAYAVPLRPIAAGGSPGLTRTAAGQTGA